MTVFVERDGGVVVGVYAVVQAGRAEEEVADDHPDVLAFRNPPVDLKAYAAAKRFEVEVGGIVFNSLTLWTDRATQSMLGRVVQCLDKGTLTAPLKMKTPVGSLSLDQAQIEAIGAAVAQHVQRAFDTEADVCDAIDLGTITTAVEIDAANWPSNT